MTKVVPPPSFVFGRDDENLSSTYQDLHKRRKRVIEAIDRLWHSGADVEWRGMGAFGAR